MSNENGKKRRFNVVDAVIILLIIACVAGVAYRTFTLKSVDDNALEYKLYFEIEDIGSESVNYFKIGDAFRTGSGTTVLGTLESFSVNGSAVGAYNDSGKPVYYPADDVLGGYARINVGGCISVMGEMTSRGLLVGGALYISPNCTLELVSEHISVTVKVTNIASYQ